MNQNKNKNTPRCGAKTRHGATCKQPAGFRTDHFGVGRCFLHGGRSTGSKSAQGKENQAQNSRKHGLYAKILTSKDLNNLKQVQEFDAGEILRDNFYLLQARTLGLIENETKFSKESKTLLQACALLIENGDIDAKFLEYLRDILEEMDTAALTRVFNSSANLATASISLDRAGAITRQLNIGKNFIVNILRNCDDQATRLLALQAVEELKADAGLPVAELDCLLSTNDEVEDNGKDESETTTTKEAP